MGAVEVLVSISRRMFGALLGGGALSAAQVRSEGMMGPEIASPSGWAKPESALPRMTPKEEMEGGLKMARQWLQMRFDPQARAWERYRVKADVEERLSRLQVPPHIAALRSFSDVTKHRMMVEYAVERTMADRDARARADVWARMRSLRQYLTSKRG